MEEQNMQQDGGFLPDGEDSVPKEVKEDVSILLPISLNKRCKYCSQVPIDDEMEEIFEVLVCRGCRYRNLKFITKTSCLSNYLLTSEELRSFRFLVRPNPHKGTWSDMNLYLEDQVEEFAVNKWGSLEEIRKTREKRSRMLEERKIKKLKGRIKDLRRRTRVASEVRKKHVHEFTSVGDVLRCECGMVIDQEEF